MKKRLIIALLSIMTFCVTAESYTVKSICQGLSKKQNTTGDFTQIKTINVNGRQLKSYGKFIICPLGIMWKTQKPFPSSVIITKNSMMQISGDGKKTMLSGSSNEMFESISSSLSAVFTGDEQVLKENFETEVKEEESANWTLILTPKDSTINSVINKLEMRGTSINNQVVMNSLEISEGSSNKIRYEFSNQEYPKELTQDEKSNFIVE